MDRKVWKWIFWIALIFLLLLMLFTVGLWALANVGAVLFRLLFILDEDLQVSGIPFPEFMSNFVGSPLFYVYMVDGIALVASAAALVVTRKQKTQQ